YKSFEEMVEAMKKVAEEGFELDRPWGGGWKMKHSDGREALVNVHINEVTFFEKEVEYKIGDRVWLPVAGCEIVINTMEQLEIIKDYNMTRLDCGDKPIEIIKGETQ
ncbi:hypothetical protein ACFQ9T_30070, partial [Bacillus cereus]